MREALEHLRTGAVAPAARDDRQGRFASARPWASSTTSSSPGASPRRRCARSSNGWPQDAELITCIAGEGAPLDPDGVAALAPEAVELELSAGGQPSYWWLLSAE